MPTDIVALVMIFGIPLSAIIGSYVLKMKKLEIEAGGGANADVARRLAQLETENRDLRTRVETLETIVTSDESPRRVRVDAGARRPASDVVEEAAAKESAAVAKSAR